MMDLKQTPLSKWCREWIERLDQAGVYNPHADVRRIVEHVMSRQAAASRPLDDDAITQIEAVIGRREKREPLARILGSTSFCGLQLKVHAGVFLPYPETEALIEPVQEAFPDHAKPLRVLDLGTGSGCLLLSVLAAFPNASGIGVDCSQEALIAARENALIAGVDRRAEFLESDWGADIQERFDLIISNPPRVPSGRVPDLLPEMREHDPRRAYDGGKDGLDFFRRIVERLETWCEPNGCGVFQVSDADATSAIFTLHPKWQASVNLNYLGAPSSVTVKARFHNPA